MTTAPPAAWLENPQGSQFPIQGVCSLGRAASNQVSLPCDKVSRRHALIRAQSENEYWLVDFGSRNGTYLNGRRLNQPTRLNHGDRLAIGSFEFVFRMKPSSEAAGDGTALGQATVTDIRQVTCWLLVADIIDSTGLVQSLPLDELPAVTGRWVAECKHTIEEHGGRINQFMGDGFFAYWREYEGSAVLVARALQALGRLQAQERPAFRMVAHHGGVVLGGFSVGEEERISGAEVHFVFRLEKLAGALGEVRLLSHPAWQRLSALVDAREAGRHQLPGFEPAIRVYAF